jgi:hypothetical protein
VENYKVLTEKNLDQNFLNQVIELFYCDDRHSGFIKSSIMGKRKRSVFRFQYQNKIYYAKKFETISLFKIILDKFRESKAKESFLKTRLLINTYDIPAANHILAIENLSNTSSIFVTEELQGINLEEYMKKHTLTIHQLNMIAIFFCKLLNFRIMYRDFNFGNFRFINGEIGILDVDSIQIVNNARSFDFFRHIIKYNHTLSRAVEDENELNFSDEEKKSYYEKNNRPLRCK